MEKGLIIKSTGSFYSVKNEYNVIVSCIARGKFRIKGIKSTNPFAVGDIVYYDFDETNDIGIIKKLEDRKNYIIRKSINLSKQSHIIAANIDIAFLVVTFSIPETTSMFIDRFLVSAEAYHIPVVLLFNKMDMYESSDIERVMYYKELYESVGYQGLEVSASSGLNLNDLKSLTKIITMKQMQ